MSSIPTEANGEHQELQRANTAALYAATMSRHLQVTHVLTCCLSQRRQFGNCHPQSVRLIASLQHLGKLRVSHLNRCVLSSCIHDVRRLRGSGPPCVHLRQPAW